MSGEDEHPGDIEDTAELVAVRIVREAAADDKENLLTRIATNAVIPFLRDYSGPPEEGGGVPPVTALTILITALGQLTAGAWAALFRQRNGHYPTAEEWAAELDALELHTVVWTPEDEDEDGE